MDLLTGASTTSLNSTTMEDNEERFQPNEEDQSDEECPRYMLAGRFCVLVSFNDNLIYLESCGKITVYYYFCSLLPLLEYCLAVL